MNKWIFCSALFLFANHSFVKAAGATGDSNKTNVSSVHAVEQTKEVILEGVVNDRDGLGLPGVSVLLEGTTYGTVTDIDGRYHLKFPGEKGRNIVYSFIGMKTQVWAYTGVPVHNVVMEPDDIVLDDVVVIGYGSKNKKSLTSSIASMDKKEMERLSATSATMDNMLAGTIKGIVLVK